ncbi:YraN family protein [Saccharicrinis fermentans]|uniref:UPF0102 protein JCM21142_93504 n=1 Tax=Saccharicrinis fermentans DSM 9555 = JCM 21142 TaxID=869213 RepID=W7Y922_9BACT|nr:YraN family protein [Saccharicrinis fermentans]GAF04787.1 hypothetical protein JCM21142_93504 [Saccharicrinis fermentans DSM 9555 = JCM 21142]
MSKHNELGKEGEQAAANYLTDKGYKILEQNWRYKHKEIDLIAQNEELLVIAEIKTRSTEEWEHPEESITKSKIRFLVDATEAYILEHDIDLEVRFDVISVVPENRGWKIDHIEEAFYPPIN